MAGTIGPLVKVAPRTWLASTLLYVVGSVSGGVVLGLLAAGAGAILGVQRYAPVVWPVVAVVGVAYALQEVGVLRLRLPLPTRLQTTRRALWLSLGPERASLLWGLQLGFGFVTVVPYAAFYFLVLCVFATGEVGLGTRVLAAYGLARAIPTVLAALPISRGLAPSFVSEWPMRYERPVRVSNTAVLLAAALLVPLLAVGAVGQPLA